MASNSRRKWIIFGYLFPCSVFRPDFAVFVLTDSRFVQFHSFHTFDIFRFRTPPTTKLLLICFISACTVVSVPFRHHNMAQCTYRIWSLAEFFSIQSAEGKSSVTTSESDKESGRELPTEYGL